MKNVRLGVINAIKYIAQYVNNFIINSRKRNDF